MIPLLLAVLGSAPTLTPLQLPAANGPLPLGPHVWILEDPSGEMTFEQFNLPEAQGRLVPSLDAEPLFGFSHIGFTHSAVWMRAVLLGGPTSRTWLLEFEYPLHDVVDVHLQYADGRHLQKASGLSHPFSDREEPHPRFVFRVEVPAREEVTLSVRVKSESALLLGMTLWDPGALHDHQRDLLFATGILYGVVLASLLYSLLTFISVRDRSYLFFALFMGAVLLLQLALDGLAFQHLWPNAPWWAKQSIPFFIALTSLGALLFTRSFLLTRDSAPHQHRRLLWSAVLSFCVAWVSLMLGYQWALVLAVGMGLVGIVTAGVSAFEAMRARVVLAGTFMVSLLVLLLSVSVAGVRQFFLFHANPWTEHGLQLGSSVMALMFTFALGRRMSMAERSALHAQEQLTRSLEGQVAARTAELENKNRQLADLNTRKDELVRTVSHDFRSPLATIRQNVQTILRDLGQMDELDMRDQLQGIGRQETRLTAMCTNLLDLARLKEGRVDRKPVDVSEVCRAMVDGLQGQAQQKGVTLHLHTPGPLTVPAEGNRLEQLVQNLLDNALKFAPRGGHVDVTLASVVDGVELRVADTGCGVPASHLGRLFEPFYQVPMAGHAGQGSGLGLAIVAAVVQAHGGSVHVDSVEGKGTTFVVRLKAVTPPGTP